jgi:hypothetical protein
MRTFLTSTLIAVVSAIEAEPLFSDTYLAYANMEAHIATHEAEIEAQDETSGKYEKLRRQANLDIAV